MAEDPSQPQRVTIHVRAMGSSGVQNYSGYYSEEYLQEIRGRQAADLWDKMRRSDSKIKMVLKAVKAPILGAHWTVQPVKEKTPEQVKHAELVEQVLFRDLPQSWTQQLREFLTMLDFGFAPFEITHKPVFGNGKFGNYSSIAKLGWRSPRTIERWNLDKDTGLLVSLSQYAYGDLQRTVDIPAQFLLVFTHDREGDNYEGVSALRPCYGPWLRKAMYQKLMAIGIEKYAVPTPKMKVPDGAEADQENFDNAKQILEKFVSHENQFIMYPEGWDVDFASPSNFDAAKIQEAIHGENAEIASAFLVNFLELGQSGSGSWALGTDLSDFMLLSIEHIAMDICEVLNRSLVRHIVDMNFGPQSEYPQLTVSGVKDKPGKEFAELVKALADGKLLTPDSALEDNLREKYDLPKRVEPIAAAAPAPTSSVPAQQPLVPAATPKVEIPEPVAASESVPGGFAIQRVEIAKAVAGTEAEALRMAQEVEVIPVGGARSQTETAYQFDLASISEIREGTLKTFSPSAGVTVYYGRRIETP